MHFRTPVLAAVLMATTTSAYAVEPCLVGVWAADLDDLAHVMGQQMNGQAQPTGGEVSMEVATDGDLSIVVDDLILNVQVPNAPAMDVSVTGYSRGTMSTDGSAWVVTSTDYNLIGSANVLGQTMTIPFSSETGMFGGGLGTYGCTPNSLSFESTGDAPRIPRRWARIG